MPEELRDTIAEEIARLRELTSQRGSKPDAPTRLAEKVARNQGAYPLPNFAVDICMQVYELARQEVLDMGKGQDLAMKTGALAYCSVMPKLSGADSIRDFIACVAHGMAITLIDGAHGARLLYAAQVAQSSLRIRKQHKKPRKSPLMQPPEAPATQANSTT